MPGSWKTGFVRSGALLLEYKFQSRPGLPWMLFLHGFGQDFTSFEPIYEKLEGAFSFISLHLPYHGESHWDGPGILLKNDWADCLEKVLLQLETGPVHAIGFSMGCKFLLSAAEKKSALFSELILLAPDGLVMNPWYRIATGTGSGRALLHFSMKLFPLFRFLISALTWSGIIRPALSRFALSELGTPEGRQRVLAVWLKFRELWPDIRILSKQCREQQIQVSAFLGRHDGILPPARYAKIRRRENWIRWEVLESGHAGLIREFARLSLKF